MSSDNLDITVNGTPKKLFMSFGLLQEISTIIGNPDDVVLVGIDPGLRLKVLNSILAERDSDGVIIQPLNLFKTNVPPDDVAKIVEWMAENILDFFVKLAEGSQKIGKELTDRVKAILPASPPGLEV